MNPITNATPAATAQQIGRLWEANLTNWALGAIAEISRADAGGDDASPLLQIGIWILRARQDVRDGIRELERQRWSEGF